MHGFYLLQKYLEYEDAQDQEKRNLQAGMESLELQNRHSESKIKSYIDQRTYTLPLCSLIKRHYRNVNIL